MNARRATILTSLLFLISLFLASPASPAADAKFAVPQYLQDISVNILAGSHQGSGTLKTTKDGQVWVLTCGHVVEGVRNIREAIINGSERKVIEFDDAKIRMLRQKDGRNVGEMTLDAEVIRYSDSDHGEDLALLRIRDGDFKPKSSAKFYLDKELPPIGSDLYHCGSLLGNFGNNSLTNGILSQHGRLINNKIYDQTNCSSYPGSSGGAVVLKDDGRYVGMLVRGVSGGFNLVVPVRRIKLWADRVKVDFILDDSKAIPKDEDLMKLGIEDGAKESPASKDEKK